MSGAQIPALGTAGLQSMWRLSERAQADAERTTALAQGNTCVQCRCWEHSAGFQSVQQPCAATGKLPATGRMWEDFHRMLLR